MKTHHKLYKLLFAALFISSTSIAQPKKTHTLEDMPEVLTDKLIAMADDLAARAEHFAERQEQLDEKFEQLGEHFEKLGKQLGKKLDHLDTQWDDKAFTEFPKDALSTAEESKKIIKNYHVSTKDKLFIENKFGNIVIRTWNKEEIHVEITIKATNATSEKALEQIKKVAINEKQLSGLIELRTDYPKQMSTKNGKCSLTVDYLIQMPAGNPLQVLNRFGDVDLEDYMGPLFVDVKFGELRAGCLKNSNNDLNISYGSASMTHFEGGKVHAKYSSFKAAKVGSMELEHGFGSLDLGESNSLLATISYSDVKIAKLNESSVFTVKFLGNFKIGDLSPTVQKLAISASYSPIEINLGENNNCSFEVHTSYSDFKSNSKLTSLKEEDEERYGLKKSYSGKIGKGDGGKILISSNFGTVKFD